MKAISRGLGIVLGVVILVWIVGYYRGSGGAANRGFAGHPGSVFRDVTATTGLSFQYNNDATPQRRFIETTGGGCAFLDFDNDGLPDIFAVQGGPAPGSSPRPRPHPVLYHNLGNGKFEDVTAKAGLAVDIGYAQGVAAADYNNDGWTDLLITTYGGSHLFQNRQGHFVEVTKQAGLVESGEAHWGTSAAWADYDGDGYLDLFVCHYASWFPDNEHPCLDANQKPMYCRPTEYVGDISVLYHNNRNGTFTDVTKQAGLSRLEGKAMGAVWLDYDGDGRPDLFVSNDMAANRLLRNMGHGAFEERAGAAGVSVGPAGQPLSGMGIAVGDFTGTGREDLFVVNFSLQPRSYFLNNGDGTFGWGSAWAGLGDSNQPFLAFGVESLDYDLDGHLDLIVGNGHINEVLDEEQGQVTARQRQQLLHNLGNGRFAEDRAAAGDLEHPRVTRGVAVGDYDNDGRPDILLSGPGSPLTLLHNEYAEKRHWIGFRLEGTRSNRDGIGARIALQAGDRKQTRVVHSGSSYCSHSDTRPLFGLNNANILDRVEIVWPSGARQEFHNLAVDRYYLLREGGACVPDPRVKQKG